MPWTKFNLEPPNGGWGWMVVFGSSLINIFNQSLLSVFGLIFGKHFSDLNESETRIALVMNLSSAFLNLTGLLTGPLLRNFSPRSVAISGCLCVSIGLMTSSLTTSLNQLIFTYSFLVGVGLGVIGPAIFIAISSYFTTKKSRAVGISMAGTGFGQMMLPQIVRYFLNEYGYQGTVLVIGGLSLHGVLGAALFQPVRWHMRRSATDVEEPTETTPLSSRSSSASSSYEMPDYSRETGFWSWLAHTLDLSLLKDPRFLILNFGLASAYAVNIDFMLILPLFLQDTGKLDTYQTAFCMSVLAAFDLMSRLSFHYFTDYLQFSHRATFMIGTLSLGIVRSIFAELSNFQSLVITCAFFGYFRAFVVVNQVLTVAEFCTNYCPAKLPGALGLNMLIKGVSVLTIGQLLGWIRDVTGSYTLSLHFQNIMLSIAMISWVIEMTWYKRSEAESSRT